MGELAPRALLPFRAMPGPKRLSLLGAVLKQVDCDRDPIRFMQDIRARYGDLVRFETRFGSLLFAFGPENNRQLHRDTDLFHSRPFVLPGPKGSAQQRLRQSIFSLNQRAHAAMRHELLPTFQKSIMPVYHGDMVQLVEQALRSWQPGQQRNLHRDMHLLVWSVVRKLIFGLEESAASEALHEAMEHWMFQTFDPWVRSLPVNLPFTPYRRMLKEAERLETQFLAIMRARRAEGARGRDALSALLRLDPKGPTGVPDEVLVGHALTLFLVAYETTGNTLTWTLFLLAQHPRVQQDVLDELRRWRGDVPPPDELRELPLLDGVLKESMRLLPAVPYSRRLAARDAAIGPYFLPRKTRVVFSHYITHHLPELYDEPERFRPERWQTIAPSPAEYMPFGAGVRTCLGASLAQHLVKVALARILPAWRLQVLPHATIDRQLGISLGPRHGIPVILHRQDRRLEASPIAGNIHEMVTMESADCLSMPVANRAAKRAA